MQNHIQIIDLILHANVFVQIILFILLLLSIISWWIILVKSSFFARVKLSNYLFLKKFHDTNNISQIYQNMSTHKKYWGVSQLFINAINEYNKLAKNKPEDKTIIIKNIERSLSATIDIELNSYQHRVPTLASFASISPYIGLLGTVWGIMHSFLGLSASQGTTINIVAPGIAEALIATAAGLIVAIPAYFFYNKFITNINSLNNQMYAFSDELINKISYYLHTPKVKIPASELNNDLS